MLTLVALFGCGKESGPVKPSGGGPNPATDTIPPQVGISSPTGGATVSGAVSIAAEARDSSGVKRVYFEVRNLCGNVLASYEDATAPFEAQWNSGTAPDGGFTICAAARDSAENMSAWTCIDVIKGTIDAKISRFVPPGVCVGDTAKAYGEHFGSKAQTSRVTLGGVDAQVVSWDDTTIRFIVPQGVMQDASAPLSVRVDCYKIATKYFDVTPPGVTRLTEDAATDGEPTYSPDGRFIYFSSNRTGDYDIWYVPARGGTAANVTRDPANDNWADINPSGAIMAWGSQRDQGGHNPQGDYEIFTGDPGSTVSEITFNDYLDRTPHWSPTNYSGYSICYSEYIDSAQYSSLPRVMLYSNSQGAVKLVAGENPAFSPNGREVVFQREGSLYKIPVDGTNEVRLTTSGSDAGPHWSWANNKIVFERFGGYTGYDIYVMNADGS
ncbi:MAG TPA: Ig-like domain-containing protein, partial [Candidatus Bathyarchaeia archaeon]|nr:Ig-like domain-containing protein [Candidatus Bathyarchaeia archaeon]